MSSVIVNQSGMNVNSFNAFKSRIECFISESGESVTVEYYDNGDNFQAVIYGNVKLTLVSRPSSRKICGYFGNENGRTAHKFYI